MSGIDKNCNYRPLHTSLTDVKLTKYGLILYLTRTCVLKCTYMNPYELTENTA